MAVVDTILAQIVTDIEALVPATRPSLRYKCWDNARVPATGTHADRGFWVGDTSAQVISMAAGVYQVQTQTEIIMRLGAGNRTKAANRTLAHNEGLAIMAAIERRTSWPAGTLAVHTGGISVGDADEESADLSVSIPLTITAGESV